MRTSKEPSGSSKRTKNSQIGDFQRRQQSWFIFFKVMGETQVFLDFSHARVPYGTNQRQWRLPRTRQERRKGPKNSRIGEFQRRRQSWCIFLQVFGRDSSCYWLLTCQGTLWNHLETLKTSKELSGTSITATKSQNGKQGVFKGDGNLDALFSR